MPLASYTLARERDGLSMPLTDWGVTQCARTLIHAKPDQLTLEFVQSFSTEPPLRSGEWITLSRDGVCGFAGTVQTIQTQATGQSERHLVQCLGAFQQLEKIIYQQATTVVASPNTAQPTLPNDLLGVVFLNLPPAAQQVAILQNVAAAQALVNWPLVSINSPLVSLGVDTDTTEVADVRDTMAKVLDFALAQSARLDYNITAMGSGWELPVELFSSGSCAEILRRLLKWRPDLVARMNYTLSPPKLVLVARAAGTPRTITCGTDGVVSVDLTRREDLEVDGVAISYHRNVQVGAVQIPGLDADSAGTPSAQRGLFLAFQIENIVLDATTGAQTGVAAPTGAATQLFNALKLPQWQGQIVMVDDDVPWIDWRDAPLNIVGGPPGWATAAALVIQVAEDLGSGRTTLTIATPDMPDTSGLRRVVRTNTPTTTSGAPAPGLPGQPPNDGSGGTTQFGQPPPSGGEDLPNPFTTTHDEYGEDPAINGGFGAKYEEGNKPDPLNGAPRTPTGYTRPPMGVADFGNAGWILKSCKVVESANGDTDHWYHYHRNFRSVRRRILDLRQYKKNQFKKVLLVGSLTNEATGASQPWTQDITGQLGQIGVFELPEPPIIPVRLGTNPDAQWASHVGIYVSSVKTYS